MESSKMYCPNRCRYRTDQLGARNYPVSREVVQGPELKYAKLRPYQFPWYSVCIKTMVISKGSYGHGEFKMYCPSRCRYRTYHCVEAKYPVSWGQYRAQNGNMRNFGPTNPNGTAFVLKEWLYQKEATGMESSKMYCPSRCRYRTDQLGARNYPVSKEVVQGPEWKYAKLRPYQSPWYCVCTKAMIIPKGSYGHGEFKNVLPQLVQISYLSLRGRNVPRFMGVVQGPEWKYAKLRPYQS